MVSYQRCELVNRHYQMRDDDLRRERGDVLGAVCGQDLLASVHLGLQGGQRPLGAGRIQVGEHSGRVRQSGKGTEGSPSLVVDQNHGQTVRWVPQSQLHQPGDE